MNTELATIFTDENAEYTALQSATPNIDMTDWQCTGTPTTGVCGTLTSSANFLITAAVGNVGYYEVEYLLSNNFWNCNFNFGNSQCGIDIRQGIAHLFDKQAFVANQANIKGTSTAIDNPVPTTSAGGLPSPNPCGYDASFPQGTAGVAPCQVGANGGTSYRLGAATGANGYPWLYAPGSADLNAAAFHLVSAGVGTGCDGAIGAASCRTSTTSHVTGVGTTNIPTFFIRNDNPPRKDLGESLASQICFVLTGVYTQPCGPLQTVEGPITAFPGFTTSKTSVNNSWWFYTAGFNGPTFFDGSLYFGYNSHFVSGIPSIQPPTVGATCSGASVPTASAGDYQYVCDPTYDNLSAQMENAGCLTAQGDPAIGAGSNLPTAPGNGLCTNGKLSAISAGIQAEAEFGAKALTLPAFETTIQYGYLNNGWIRAINNAGSGLPNYFTWLNAWNPTPAQSGTLRQGFKQTTRSINPYISSTIWDTYISGEVIDSLFAANPLAPSQSFDWMTYTAVQQDNATVIAQSGYQPPAGTLTTYHFTLRNDVFFQDGRPVTAYDVAFSYLSMVGSGAFLGTGASSMTGFTVLGLHAFDIGVNSLGPFTLPNLTGIYILPGRYWSGAGSSAWDSAIAACSGITPCPKAQYSLSGPNVVCPTAGGQPGCASFTATNMNIDPAKTAATYDPIANHIFVGSGPFQCGTVTSTGSGICTSTGSQNPPVGGSYTLTRFGNGLAPASSTSGIYFRSSGDLALYLWTQENDVAPIAPVSAVSLCFNQPLNFGSCAHWQQGIGASSNGIVGTNQVSEVELRYNLNWVSPKNWASDAPLGIGALPPVLYEGSATLNPCTIQPTTGYDC
jgi:hypothetical protein